MTDSAKQDQRENGVGSREMVRCFKHYCRICHAMNFVRYGNGKQSEYPRCCGKPMAYLGIVDAIPGRDETLMREPSSPNEGNQP